MKLKTGDDAIDFTAVDIYGKEVKLSDYKGKKIILGFYRNVTCPFCNRRIHQILSQSTRLKESGIQMLFIFESNNKKLSESSFHQGISPFPLIGNPERDIYKQYGVENSLFGVVKTVFVSSFFKAVKDVKPLNLPTQDKEASSSLMPADFLIDEHFKIVKAHYGTHMDDHIPIEEIKDFALI
jgi:peroxiredoxin